MINFDSEFLKKKILIVSDVDDDPMDIESTNIERKYIELKMSQMSEYGFDADYAEVLTAKDLVKLLKKYDNKNTIIFNWCERFNYTDLTEDQVVKIFEDFGFSYTGPNYNGLVLLANKFEVKNRLAKRHILVPEYYLVSKDQISNPPFAFNKKYIIKSNKLHASTGITSENIFSTKKEYLAIAEKLVKFLNTDLLVEEFIAGQEYTAVVWGNENPITLPILEVDYKNKSGGQILTNQGKFGYSEEYNQSMIILADMAQDPSKFNKLKKFAVETYKALDLYDYARVDFRVRGKDIYVIDVNGNPYINVLDDSEVYMATETMGYNYGETILKICEFAFKRNMHYAH